MPFRRRTIRGSRTIWSGCALAMGCRRSSNSAMMARRRAALVSLLLGAVPHLDASEARPMQRASGEFDVKATALAPPAPGDEALGRMSLDKHYHGELQADARGEMLTAMTSMKGSAELAGLAG